MPDGSLTEHWIPLLSKESQETEKVKKPALEAPA